METRALKLEGIFYLFPDSAYAERQQNVVVKSMLGSNLSFAT